MEPKPRKRIVSKGAYAAAMGQKAALGAGTLILFLLTTLLFLIALIAFFAGVSAWAGDWPVWDGPFGVATVTPVLKMKCWAVSLVCIAAGAGIKWATEAGLKKTAQSIDVLLLTRANTAALPAPDSLVRASSEPVQAQEAVLLRAAAQGQETPAEELVRASVGQE